MRLCVPVRLLPLAALALIAFAATPAGAHSFTSQHENDPGRVTLRSDRVPAPFTAGSAFEHGDPFGFGELHATAHRPSRFGPPPWNRDEDESHPHGLPGAGGWHDHGVPGGDGCGPERPSEVPEPGTVLLLGAGLAGLAATGRRRR